MSNKFTPARRVNPTHAANLEAYASEQSPYVVEISTSFPERYHLKGPDGHMEVSSSHAAAKIDAARLNRAFWLGRQAEKAK